MIRSLADYFDVKKDDDIRMVYNRTSCGLNWALWAPNFWLPTSKSALHVLDFGYFSVDVDLGQEIPMGWQRNSSTLFSMVKIRKLPRA